MAVISCPQSESTTKEYRARGRATPSPLVDPVFFVEALLTKRLFTLLDLTQQAHFQICFGQLLSASQMDFSVPIKLIS